MCYSENAQFSVEVDHYRTAVIELQEQLASLVLNVYTFQWIVYLNSCHVCEHVFYMFLYMFFLHVILINMFYLQNKVTFLCSH